MKFTAHLRDFKSALWGHHVIVPPEIARAFLEANSRRIVCTLNNTHTFQCALMHGSEGEYFININAAIRKKLRLVVGVKIEIELKKDESKYGLPMPEEMETLLQIDDTANQLFHALTPGKQRALLHIVGKPKRSETRINKAIVIVDYLKSTNGKLDFKELNEAFRNHK